MYKQYFGFVDAPFSIAPDPRYLYLSDRHREALAHLIYGVGDQGGFVLLTGEVGTGKTTICRSLLQQLPPKTDVAYIVNPKQTINQLLISITTDFGIFFDEDDTSKDLIDHLNRYLLRSHAEGRNAVLIIDEAQNLSVEVLEQLRLLTNLETNEKKLLQLVLLGQPELNVLLARKELRQLEQRVTARFHLKPLSKEEVAHYIEHRLSVAGSRENLFSPAAVNKIYKASGGIPRLINKICDRCLLGIYSQDQHQVSRQVVGRAVKELSGNGSVSDKKKYSWLLLAVGVSVVVVVLLMVMDIFSSKASNLTDNKSNAVAPFVGSADEDEALAVLHPKQDPEALELIFSFGDKGDDIVDFQRLLVMADSEYAASILKDLSWAKPYVIETGSISKLARLYNNGLYYPQVSFSGVYDYAVQRVIERLQERLALPVKSSVDSLFMSRLESYVSTTEASLVAAVTVDGSEG
jgi:general secretion pathway protein A